VLVIFEFVGTTGTAGSKPPLRNGMERAPADEIIAGQLAERLSAEAARIVNPSAEAPGRFPSPVVPVVPVVPAVSIHPVRDEDVGIAFLDLVAVGTKDELRPVG
jgi:hypothetical protein